MLREFKIRSTESEIPATLLEGRNSQGEEKICSLSNLLFLLILLQERCFAIFLAGVLTGRKNRKTFSSLFVSSQCLGVSSPDSPEVGTGGENSLSRELGKTVNEAAQTMTKLAEGKGVTLPAGATVEAQAGSLTDPKAVGELLNKLSETKAMMEATRLLMDEAINKPVVVDWLEGTK